MSAFKEDGCIFPSLLTVNRVRMLWEKSDVCVAETHSEKGDDEDLDREQLVFRGMGMGEEVEGEEGMMDGSENIPNKSHTEEIVPENEDKESEQKILRPREKDFIEKASEEDEEEEIKEEEYEEEDYEEEEDDDEEDDYDDEEEDFQEEEDDEDEDTFSS